MTARSAKTLLESFEPDRWATAFAPAIEFCDPRTVGMGSVHGADALLPGIRALFELTADWSTRVDEILDLRSDALLVRWTNFGTDRASGGAFERNLCILWTFGVDGLLTRWEQSEADRDAEALARFDELVGSNPSVSPLGKGRTKEGSVVHRRVRPNAATANWARISAVIAARDADALNSLVADEANVVNHPMHWTHGRSESLDVHRALIKAQDGALVFEPLATLGDSLALGHQRISASGATGEKFDIGPYEVEHIAVIEADERGCRRYSEFFAADRLGDAIVRLYECYADLLPDGTARDRAAATARSVAAMLGPYDPDRYAPALALAIEVVDRRTLGTWSARGAETFLQHVRAMVELADTPTMREDEVLSLQSDALLVRRTHCGTDRAGGGAYERPFIDLLVFGIDGLLTRIECFDADRDAAALARFDELVGRYDAASAAEPPATRLANAATRSNDRFVNAWAARDWERVAATFALDFRLSDRRSFVRLDLDRDQHLESLRLRFQMGSSRVTSAILATRGDRLALGRVRFELADGYVGPSDTEALWTCEVDEQGKRVTMVAFNADDLDAAYAELDERYAPGEAAPFARSAAGVRAFSRALAGRDWDAMTALYAPDFIMRDHRPLGWETLRG
ncbi:MAG: hypothetical protein HY027_15185 [Deltaproteobacteria bacterium]|nr:hypothetical protein [Deltaproteobacteria bacterium]